MERICQFIGVCRHHQRTILICRLLHRLREFRNLLDEFDLVLCKFIVEGRKSRVAQHLTCDLRLPKNRICPHMRVLNVRSCPPVERKRRIHVEDDVFVVIHCEHGICQRAHADLLGDLAALLFAHLRRFFRFHSQHAPHRFIINIFEQHHPPAPRRHSALRQADKAITEVVALLRLRKTPQAQNRKCLLQVHGLAHIHHINRTIHVILLEFGFRQRQVFRQVERRAVRTQDDVGAVFFLLQTEFLVNLHNHRAALRAFVVGNAFGNQFFHDGFGGFIHFAFVEPHVNLHIYHAQNLAQFFQAPLARFAPQFAHIRVARIPFAIHLAPFGFILLPPRCFFGRFVLFLFEQSGGFHVQLQQPLSAFVNALGFLPFVKLVVHPHHGDDAQPNVTGVRSADGLIACKVRQPRQHLAENRIAVMPNVKRVMRVWLGVFDHHALSFRRAPSKVCAGGEDGLHYPPRISGGFEIDVEIAFHRFDAADSLHASHLTSNLVGNFLRSLRDGFPSAPACAGFVCRRLEERGGDTPFSREGNGNPFEFGEFDGVRRADGFYSFLELLINIVEHCSDYNNPPPVFAFGRGEATKAGAFRTPAVGRFGFVLTPS